ncbi:MAG: hypothetical protein E7643_02745 [Ruminococcaceae bacterium]|nr:hypothetical protein [Oscillospiraceae bacterium]
MQIDQKTLSRLLAMNDEQLSTVIKKIAVDAGIDPTALGITQDSIESIRTALGSVSDRDLEALNEVYQSFRQGKTR